MSIISSENKVQLINRFKSFLWRFASMAGVIFLGFIADNLNLFQIDGEVAVVIGLILGEVTKYLNTKRY